MPANHDHIYKSAVCADCGQTGLYKRHDGLWECGTCGRLIEAEPKLNKGKRAPGPFITRKA